MSSFSKIAHPRFKSAPLTKMYEAMLELAQDTTSELYHKGEPRRGAGHRAAFWDGYSGRFTLTGPKRSAQVIPMTLSHACFVAGVDFARQDAARKHLKDASSKYASPKSKACVPNAPTFADLGVTFRYLDIGQTFELDHRVRPLDPTRMLQKVSLRSYVKWLEGPGSARTGIKADTVVFIIPEGER